MQYEIGVVQWTLTDASRSDREVPVTIYYPSLQSGTNVPVADTGQVFPVLVFGHGFVIGIDKYDYLWQGLVPQGYVIAFPATEGGIPPNHGRFGEDIAFVADTLVAAGTDPGSAFFGRVAPTAAVMGHSMGGGAAFLATGHSTNIGAIAVLAPANTSPSAVDAAGATSLPALILAGSKDNVTPISQHQQPMYDALPTQCKYLVPITEGSHCQFAQGSFLCDAGEFSVCPFCSFIADATQKGVTVELLSHWLDYTLRGAGPSLDALNGALAGYVDAGVLTYSGGCAGR